MAVSDMNSDQHYFCAVSDLHKAGRLDTKLLREVPVLYRWWFPEDSAVMDIIEAYVDAHPRDYKMLYMKNNLKIRTFDVNGKTQDYYALYFGKSSDGHRRFYNHIRGPQSNSTLRRTIAALLGNDDEDTISAILMECCYEWVEFANDPELIDSIEMMAIAMGSYPLNIDGNQGVSSDWKQHLKNNRK